GRGDDGREPFRHGWSGSGRGGFHVCVRCSRRSKCRDRSYGTNAGGVVRPRPHAMNSNRATVRAPDWQNRAYLMTQGNSPHHPSPLAGVARSVSMLAALVLIGLSACAPSPPSTGAITPAPGVGFPPRPDPDPRVGLAPGLTNAEEAIWNLRLL